VVLAGFCLVFSLQTLLAVARTSATVDEPSDLVSGYVELTRGNYWLKPETLPLLKMAAAAPLLFLRVRTPEVELGDVSRFYDRVLYELNDADTLLMAARATVLVASLVLGCLVFGWTRRLFGWGAAVFTLFLYTFEPNLVAHAALVTTDLGVACFFFLAVHGLFRVVERVSVPRVLAVALGLSLAVVTKLSTGSLVLVLGLLALIAGVSTVSIPVRIFGRSALLDRRGAKLVGLALVLLVAGLVAYGAVWATYGFDYRAAESIGRPLTWSEVAADGTPAAHALAFIRRTRILPEPYVYNFFQHVHLSGLFPAYLLGEVRQGGWWYYFLVTLLVKTPLALLIAMSAGLALLALRWRSAPLVGAFLGVPVVIYFVLISASGFNMGHRHLLAILPFLIVAAGAVIPWAATHGVWAKGGVALLSLWYLASSLSIWPHHISYFNELAGGPRGGAQYLADSNLDWGQDLKGLERYMEQQGIERVWLSYFGTANPDYHGIRYDALPGSVFPAHPPIRPDLLAADRLPKLPGTIAISMTNLQGVYLPFIGVKRDYFAAYRDVEPVARIGYSILVYRVD
jgi:hypothetical protein